MTDKKTYHGSRGEYTLVEPSPFAHGRTSALFRVTDADGVEWCLKEFTQIPLDKVGREAPAEFIAEIASRERMWHANILPIHDHGSAADGKRAVPFIVMPLCECDLRRRMKGRAFVPLAEAMTVLRQIAAAIDFAHSQGLVHGDVKPENILFQRGGAHALLSDFGTSHFFAFNEAMVTAASISHGGTTAYLSPEQIQKNEQTARSDIYSFGVVAFEMLTGKMPIDPALPQFPQMQAKVSGQHRDARSLNPALSETIAAALSTSLAVDPAARPPTAAALCASIAGNHSPERSRAVPRVEREAGASVPPRPEVVGRTAWDAVATHLTYRNAAIALLLLACLASFVHWQAEPGSDVRLFGQELWRKGGSPARMCVATKHISELSFTSGNKTNFCKGTPQDGKNTFDGVLSMPGAEYQDSWCYRGDLDLCRADVVKKLAVAAE